jgi:periplasmic protein TonB
MNKNIILSLVALACILPGCNPKEKKTSETVNTPTVAEQNKLTREEKRASLEKKRIALAQKRQAEWETRIKTTPFYTDETKTIVYNKAEQDPTFVGGESAMNAYLLNAMKYPEQAEREGLEGTVFVDFIVTANGSVREVNASEMPGEHTDASLQAEAIRVVRNMPKWTPGRQRGKPVDVKFSLPITFQMI